jgi:hypothetical protein
MTQICTDFLEGMTGCGEKKVIRCPELFPICHRAQLIPCLHPSGGEVTVSIASLATGNWNANAKNRPSLSSSNTGRPDGTCMWVMDQNQRQRTIDYSLMCL